MYRNINNMYYFNRPDYGHVCGNPYGLNFSRNYPRVVVYGQQNFNDPNVLQRFKEAFLATSPYQIGELQERLRSMKGQSVLPEQLGHAAQSVLSPLLFTNYGDVYSAYEKRARYRGEEPSYNGFIKEAWNWPKHERDYYEEIKKIRARMKENKKERDV